MFEFKTFGNQIVTWLEKKKEEKNIITKRDPKINCKGNLESSYAYILNSYYYADVQPSNLVFLSSMLIQDILCGGNDPPV